MDVGPFQSLFHSIVGTWWADTLFMLGNPFVDYHVIYVIVLVVLALASAGETWGLGRRWARLPFVTRHPITR